MKPLVSILIPTYNRPHYVGQAIGSVLRQTYPHIEMIVSDNSEDEQTELVVKRLQSQPGGAAIRYVRNAKNIGPLANQRQCLDLATGEYVNYLMDDDWFHPQKIERMVPYLLAHPQVSLVTARRKLVSLFEASESVPRSSDIRRRFIRDAVVDGRELARTLVLNRNNYIGEPTCVLFRRKHLTGPFGAFRGMSAAINVDVATWLALLERHDAVFLSKPLSYFRIHSGQLSHGAPSRLARLCDWIDHTIALRATRQLHKAEFVRLMEQLQKPVGRDIPKWNRRSGGLYADEVSGKLGQWIKAVKSYSELDAVAARFRSALDAVRAADDGNGKRETQQP